MIATAQRKVDAGQADTILTHDARCGRDWVLTVGAGKAATATVTLTWQGGRRDLVVDAEVGPGPTDIELPARLTGTQLEVTVTTAITQVVSVCLGFTPDCACHPEPAQC